MISLLLPTFNERENIEPLIEALDSAVSAPHEIIVVDDDSPDGTWKIVEEIMKRKPHVRLERRRTDHGLTKSIQRGIDLARGEIIVWMDCDLSMPPATIPHLVNKILEGYDIAVGSRFVPGGKQKTIIGESGESPAAIILSSLGCFAMRYLLFPSFRDYTSGFIAIRKEVLHRIRLHGSYGEYFIDLIVRTKLLGYRIVEIPYIFDVRRAGESKTAPTISLLLYRCMQYGTQILRMEWLRVKHLLGSDLGAGGSDSSS